MLVSKLFKKWDFAGVLVIPAIIAIPTLLLQTLKNLNGRATLSQSLLEARPLAGIFCCAGAVYLAVISLRALDLVTENRSVEEGRSGKAERSKPRTVTNVGGVLFCVGIFGSLGSIGFWPGYAVALPVFLTGAFLLIASERKLRQQDRLSDDRSGSIKGIRNE